MMIYLSLYQYGLRRWRCRAATAAGTRLLNHTAAFTRRLTLEYASSR